MYLVGMGVIDLTHPPPLGRPFLHSCDRGAPGWRRRECHGLLHFDFAVLK